MPIWKVTAKDSGSKLLHFIKQNLDSSYTVRQVKKSMEQNGCLVNGRVERFGSRHVGTGDEIEFVEGELNLVKKNVLNSSEIFFSDDSLLICNKAAGIPSDSPDLLKYLKGSAPFLELIHRLDKETTGLLIFAKTPQVASQMKSLFKERKVKKEYWAIVDGLVKESAGFIDNFLGKIHVYRGQTLWGEVKVDGLRAVTEWKRLKKGKETSLIACYPLTGRTHQLRVHLSSLGYPILGDKQYARKVKCRYHPSRCLLHARQLQFPHPLTDKMVSFSIEPPEDFQEAMILLGLGKT